MSQSLSDRASVWEGGVFGDQHTLRRLIQMHQAPCLCHSLMRFRLWCIRCISCYESLTLTRRVFTLKFAESPKHLMLKGQPTLCVCVSCQEAWRGVWDWWPGNKIRLSKYKLRLCWKIKKRSKLLKFFSSMKWRHDAETSHTSPARLVFTFPGRYSTLTVF